ncbi:MAG: pyruvate formate-lyase-activating protein [Sporolactobacillus sp.]
MNCGTFEPSRITGYIHAFESFGAVDGPGIRFVVFMQGCQMRCRYCHNPDTWQPGTGQQLSASDVLASALAYRCFWGDTGGLTVSGGEPLLQIDFVTALFEQAKQQGISTCLDTSGAPFTREQPFFAKFERLMAVTDLLLVDLKTIDEDKHRRLTGWTNKGILEMCRYLSSEARPVWIRHVLVPEWTDNDAELIALEQFIHTLSNVKRVEVLPYHAMGAAKYERMGLHYALQGVQPPSTVRIKNAERILRCGNYR